MKFLVKRQGSEILKKNLIYDSNKSNADLCEELKKEQMGFCAYTEKVFDGHDAVEVEHLRAEIKENDNYYNYYAVIRKANLFKMKKDRKYKESDLWNDMFFQKEGGFESRIKYVKGVSLFEPIDPKDQNAKDFIDLIGLNEYNFVSDRREHIIRIRDLFIETAHVSSEFMIEYFKKYKSEMSFITALEHEFGLDVDSIIKKNKN